jgi:uncharacterized repeat protein (TIGR01451 family)
MTFVSLLSLFSGCISVPAGEGCGTWKTRFGQVPLIVLASILLATLTVPQRSAAQIQVAPNSEGNTFGSCSLQEAIYATEFGQNIAIDATDPDDTYSTGCSDASGSWNTIDLPGGTLSFTKSWDGDAHNPFGPTATPIIFSTITIRGHGTTLQWTPAGGAGYSRLFAVGEASISPRNGVLTTGTYSGTGNLTLQDVYVKGFQAKGGDGGQGGGGGLGAGGAIYVGKLSSGVPALTVENSTFEANGATGGNGAPGLVNGSGFDGDGGGGGLGGDGSRPTDIAGGGGGGSTGGGGLSSDSGACDQECQAGGGGGGTVLSGGAATYSASGVPIGGAGGYLCGGNGGDPGNDGTSGKCSGGGGGGGGFCVDCDITGNFDRTGNGGNGAYGGGGGGGSSAPTDVSDPTSGSTSNGGGGGFGGGGGSAHGQGGKGGFGGGGGTGDTTSNAGAGGHFGGNAGTSGGGGGALGGAIFNDSGTIVVLNSTFYNNFVSHGVPINGTASPAGDSGGAIFSRNGSLTVQNATISGNQATGAGGGIVVMNDGATTTFVLDNTIIANNGAQECIMEGSVTTSSSGVNSAANLIVLNSGTSGSEHPCPQATVTSDPMLDSLKLNAPGDTPTMALQAGSPAIDAGDDTYILATDQRGVARPVGAHTDIGAYERIPQADLSLSKTVLSSTAKAGDTVTYTVTVTNLGPDPANNVTVTDNFPTALTFVSCTAPGASSCGTQGATVVATYASLAASASQTITIKGTLNTGFSRGTVITNDASAQASSPDDPDTTNNSASVSFMVIVPDFTITADSPITIALGGTGTSTVTLGSIDTFSSAVNLTSTGPSNFLRSFSPNPATPPSNGSTTSTLTIVLEPSVTTGTYTVNVTGTSGTLTHSTSITVNVVATIPGMMNVINTDQGLGCIDNSGIIGALQSKLNAAQNAFNSGQTQVEINTLQALLNQLYAQAGKHIKTACTDDSGQSFNPDAVLVSDVNALLVNAGANLKANPIIGNVTNASGAGLAGLTVNILNSRNATIATATTDATGFYYYAATGGLSSGASYSVKVTVPKAYRNSTPSSQSFTWRLVGVALNNFVVN